MLWSKDIQRYSSPVIFTWWTRPIIDDGEAGIEEYNAGLEDLATKNKNTWFTAPWLYAECYLYRRLRSLFRRTIHWLDFDPFLAQKLEMFKHSRVAIFQLAQSMHELEAQKEALLGDESKLQVLFNEMIQMCLWGNATDLSLLTHLSPEDIKNLQTVGKDAQAARKEFILRDDQSKAWDHVKTLHNARVDFVLDNAGFEVFTDFVFADFLVTYTPYVSTVTFHPKLIPWFVSDVTPPDFVQTIESLLDPSFFPPPTEADSEQGTSIDQYELLRIMVTRWKKYVEDGTFTLSVPTTTPLGGMKFVSSVAEFWTSPWPYWRMHEHAPGLFKWLSNSGLVIFKVNIQFF
ncbi:hypothetical protein HGRIS_006170 [Hohenbuehelia grisea]|uniref:Sugar phosphate phosphatase n=1 Tax=Hohenbuehelia grisea TaxID=104357 RepID=A0ABR3K1N0_9AGAR